MSPQVLETEKMGKAPAFSSWVASLCWPPRSVRGCCWREGHGSGGHRKTRCYSGTPPVIAVSWNSPTKPADPTAQGHTHSQTTWYHDVTRRVLGFYFFPGSCSVGLAGLELLVYPGWTQSCGHSPASRCWGYRSVPPPSVGRGSLRLCFPLMGSEVREAGTAVSLNRGCGEITTELFKSFLLISGKEILI